MKAVVRWVLLGVLIIAAAGCFFRSLQMKGQLKGATGFADILLNGQMSMEQVKGIVKPEEEAEDGVTYSLVFLTESENRLEWKDTLKSIDVTVVSVAGQTNILADNKWLDEEDEDGCLISEDAASELFGGTDVVGQEVALGEQRYVIRAVVSDLKDSIIIYGTADTQFTRVRVSLPKRKSASQVKEALSSRYGISGTLLEYSIFYELASGMVWLLPLILVISFLVWLRKNAKAANDGKEKALWWGITIAVIILVGFLGSRMIRLPREMVPSRWSDFSFWTRLFSDKKEALGFLLNTKKSIFDEHYMGVFIKIMLSSLLSAALYFLAIICYTMRRTNR